MYNGKQSELPFCQHTQPKSEGCDVIQQCRTGVKCWIQSACIFFIPCLIQGNSLCTFVEELGGEDRREMELGFIDPLKGSEKK